jgi:hypothetical protein
MEFSARMAIGLPNDADLWLIVREIVLAAGRQDPLAERRSGANRHNLRG